MEILLISSRSGKGYVFPKGGWEVDEELEAAARRETVEEAGVRGILELPMVGTFTFSSGKAERLQAAHKGRCSAHMFVLSVGEVLDEWPEGGQRHRVWCSIPEAYARCRYDWMREALAAWLVRKGWPVPTLPEGHSPVAATTNGNSLVSSSPSSSAAAVAANGNGANAATPATPNENTTAHNSDNNRGITVQT